MEKRHNFVLEKYGKLQSHCCTKPAIRHPVSPTLYISFELQCCCTL